MREIRFCHSAAISVAIFGLCAGLVSAQGARGKSGPDCNSNGIPDSKELDGNDCNQNGIPDECDIASGTSADCNNDELPDECPACPPVDLVFVMDTSGSMSDEGEALCAIIGQVVADLLADGIQVTPTILGITANTFSCLEDNVLNLLGSTVPGPDPGPPLNHPEDWGPATAVVAGNFSWLPGAVRVIVPISDEAAQNGGSSCTQADQDSIDNAIVVAVANGVFVSPISGTGSQACVIALANDLAAGTGGSAFVSTNPKLDLATAISDLVLDACTAANDCNRNGIPDECEPDNNGNGIPDDCEEGTFDLVCTEFDRYEELTADDTLTLITNFHNPDSSQGFLQVVAVNSAHQPIGFDYLVGHSMIISGLESFEYSINPVDYRAMVMEDALSDIDGDTVLDLNGVEYEKTAGEILIPRFFGEYEDPTQGGQLVRGELILIALSGGRQFQTSLDFLVHNDNEEEFSTSHTFRCWERVFLGDISGVFTNDFLANFTNHDPAEHVFGAESGWMTIDGGVAVSSAASIQDPAFYAVYVEHILGVRMADLPFERCLQSGHLLPDSVTGDNEESGAAGQSCQDSIGRRKPASLLLFPEYDNRGGEVSLITVTNTNAQAGVTAHYIYVGRYGN